MREDWVESSLGEVCKITLGQSPLSTDCNNQKIGLPFFQGKAEFTSKYPIPRVWCAKPKKIANADSILLSVRAPVGSTNVAFEKCGIGRGLAALEYDLCQDFILFYLKAIEQELDSKGTGTTFRAISGDILRNQKIPLPPLPEQRAIVKKLESLFSSLDAGVADLKKAQQQLKIYRQAVLKKAFEGNDSWSYKIIKDVIKTIDGDRGKNYPKKNEFFQEEYCLFLSTKNVRNGKFLFEDNLFITKDKDSELRSGKLERGDIVLTTRGTLGNVALFDDEIRFENIRINSGMLILRIKDHKELNQKYLMNFINSPIFFDQLKSKQSGTAQPQIPANILKEIIISFPQDIEEQKDIVKQIESRLSVCDSIEQNIAAGLEKAEALRQSILKKAFEGNLLTAQELAECKLADDYEPASVLLEKIKAEQTEIKAKPSKKKPRHSVAKSQ